MSNKSNIEWTQATWNPIIGCSHISEGCEHCYAARMAGRLAEMGVRGYCDSDVIKYTYEVGYLWTGKAHLVRKELDKPLHRKKPTTYFVCDMGDLFHPTVTDDMFSQVLRIIALCPQHTFLLLTKRPQRMGQLFNHEVFVFFRDLLHDKQPELKELPLPNVYLGITAENQETADERIPELLKTPAAGHFVSIEPMLARVDLNGYLGCDICRHPDSETMPEGQAVCPYDPVVGGYGLRTCNFRGGLDQVILGGESGPGARPMVGKWAQWVRDDCRAAEVPFFFKQWGDYLKRDKLMAHVEAANGYNPREKKGGRVLDGTTCDELIWRADS